MLLPEDVLIMYSYVTQMLLPEDAKDTFCICTSYVSLSFFLQKHALSSVVPAQFILIHPATASAVIRVAT